MNWPQFWNHPKHPSWLALFRPPTSSSVMYIETCTSFGCSNQPLLDGQEFSSCLDMFEPIYPLSLGCDASPDSSFHSKLWLLWLQQIYSLHILGLCLPKTSKRGKCLKGHFFQKLKHTTRTQGTSGSVGICINIYIYIIIIYIYIFLFIKNIYINDMILSQT